MADPIKTYTPSGFTEVNPADPSYFGWPPQLVYEMAMGDASPQEVCEAYGMSKQEAMILLNNPIFVAHFNRAREEMLEHGMPVRTKAMLVVDEGIGVVRGILHDKEAPPMARLEAFKQLTALAELAQKKTAADVPNGGATPFQININMNATPNGALMAPRPTITLDHE